MIEARELTKRYGDTTAVHSLSFTIAPGTVTGFLGPNGAGKVRPQIDRRYAFAELPAAIAYLEQGHARGKVVAEVA